MVIQEIEQPKDTKGDKASELNVKGFERMFNYFNFSDWFSHKMEED